jgi:F-type H+-transporting ATPase subunit b
MQIDWWSLGFQTINFLVVVWLLTRFLYRPVRRSIEAREAEDRKLADEAQAKSDAADAAREDYQGKVAELAEAKRRQEAELHAEMEKERAAVLDKAKAAADDMVAEARDRIARERDEALAGLKDDIVALARDLAATALVETGGPGNGLPGRVAAHLDAMKSDERDELRRDVLEGGGVLSVVTASKLDDDEQGRWRTALTERLGEEAKIGFVTDPDILGGAELRFPHAVLSFSVAERLRQAAEDLKG